MLRKVRIGLKIFATRLRGLFVQPIFIVVTIIGNSCILAGAGGLYFVEHGSNPKLQSALDALWWSVATVTTVGYGDISPITTAGKIIGIAMMIVGTALFWSYTALFAGALLSQEIEEFEELEREVKLDEKKLHQMITQMEATLGELKRLRGGPRSAKPEIIHE
jgi:voltage-gated potassium channel